MSNIMKIIGILAGVGLVSYGVTHLISTNKQDKTAPIAEEVIDLSTYPGCPYRSIIQYMAQGMTIPTDCYVETGLMALSVFQQLPDGTLVKYHHRSVPGMIFVEKHPEISKLVDGQRFVGLFTGRGTYQYTNVFGGLATVQRVKYLGTGQNE